MDYKYKYECKDHEFNSLLDHLKEVHGISKFKIIETKYAKTLKSLKKFHDSHHKRIENRLKEILEQ